MAKKKSPKPKPTPPPPPPPPVAKAPPAHPVGYKVVIMTLSTAPDLEATLNTFGIDEWDLVEVLDRGSFSNQIICLFKRQE